MSFNHYQEDAMSFGHVIDPLPAGPSYSVGSVIIYTAFGGTSRKVRVTVKDPNVKNGEPGFVGKLVGGESDGMGVWGYDHQIERVVS